MPAVAKHALDVVARPSRHGLRPLLRMTPVGGLCRLAYSMIHQDRHAEERRDADPDMGRDGRLDLGRPHQENPHALDDIEHVGRAFAPPKPLRSG